MDNKESCPANPYIHSLNSRYTNVYPPTTDRAADIWVYKSCNDHDIPNIVDKKTDCKSCYS